MRLYISKPWKIGISTLFGVSVCKEEINGARREERAEERAKESARNEGQTKLAQTKINLDKSSLASKYNYGNKHTHTSDGTSS